jgi:UDP-3-O-[3-hydroxymyristoyl] glucosamine N-acyltransferase
MIVANNKPVMIIGFELSTLTQEYYEFLSFEKKLNLTIISPDDFLNLENKDNFQYIVAFALDLTERQKICNIIDRLNLDCITYIHNSCIVSPSSTIKKGSFISPFSFVGVNSIIHEHCFISVYCVIAHHVNIKRNTIIQCGVKIAGRTNIGENCVFNFGSSSLNKLKITDNVVVGAYSNLTKDVLEPGYYVGNIARKYNADR